MGKLKLVFLGVTLGLPVGLWALEKPGTNFVTLSILTREQPRELTLSTCSNEKIEYFIDHQKGFLTAKVWLDALGETVRLQSGGKVLQGSKCILSNKAFSLINLSFITPDKRLSSRKYSGVLEVTSANSCLQIKNLVSPENYARQVVFAEYGEAVPVEAARALYVVIMTRIELKKPRHLMADFCDLTHCQYSLGEPPVSFYPLSLLSVGPCVLFENGKLKDLFFHANSGGILFEEALWDSKAAKFRLDQYSGEDLSTTPSQTNWMYKIDKEKVHSLLSKKISQTLTKIETQTNLFDSLIYYETKNDKGIINKDNFRLLINQVNGWNSVPSPVYAFLGDSKEYHFVGKGFGHSVGLSQDGAVVLAKRGLTWKEILKFYYPNKQLYWLEGRTNDLY